MYLYLDLRNTPNFVSACLKDFVHAVKIHGVLHVLSRFIPTLVSQPYRRHRKNMRCSPALDLISSNVNEKIIFLDLVRKHAEQAYEVTSCVKTKQQEQ